MKKACVRLGLVSLDQVWLGLLNLVKLVRLDWSGQVGQVRLIRLGLSGKVAQLRLVRLG